MSEFLKNINSSHDVKSLNLNEKKTLCDEIRKEIIETVSENGGHLASNLGVVELTVALFSKFNLPQDNIVWDVGHQCYAHKLLSGRFNQFHTIRKENGISGFPSIDESDYDPFTTGHSSTSISSALGLSVGNEINDVKNYTVAVIGDGALTGGLAYEGLNNAGRRRKNFIVILNDNNMSISKNVGAMSRYLGMIRSRPKYLKAKSKVETALRKVPVVGNPLARFVKKTKGFIKRTFYNSTLFDDMGFAYYGPYDGHDLELLEEVLETVKTIDKPILIHVNSKKGKGYEYAEGNPKAFHGVPKFDLQSGTLATGNNSFSNVFGNCLSNMATLNPKICAITAAMSSGTGLVDFSNNFKNRFFDVGIAEAHAVTFAAGLSKKGLIPVFAVYSTFLQRAYPSLMHDISLQKLKLVLAIDRAGVVGDDGKTHQGIFDVSYLKTIPNNIVFCPSYFDELDFTLQKAVRMESSLICVRYPRGHEQYKPKDFITSNNDFDIYGDLNSKNVIVCYGRIFSEAVLALEKSNLSIKIVKLNRIFPIPEDALKACLEAKSVLFVEEAFCGIANDFGIKLYQSSFKGKYIVDDIKDGFVPHANMERQLSNLKLDSSGILEFINEFF